MSIYFSLGTHLLPDKMAMAYCLGWLSWPLKNKNIHLEIGIHSDFFLTI